MNPNDSNKTTYTPEDKERNERNAKTLKRMNSEDLSEDDYLNAIMIRISSLK